MHRLNCSIQLLKKNQYERRWIRWIIINSVNIYWGTFWEKWQPSLFPPSEKSIQLRKLATNKLKEDLAKQVKYYKFWALEFIFIFLELDQSLLGSSHKFW